MYEITIPFFLHALTSIHAGSGSELGIVDLPIQREKHTGYPKIEASSLKGAIRASAEAMAKNSNGADDQRKTIDLIFGKKPKGKEKLSSEDMRASMIAFADARTLLFPVKSMRGVFALITCPAVLDRFNYELNAFEPDPDPTKAQFTDFKLPVPPVHTVSSDKLLITGSQMVLEEYPYQVAHNHDTEQLAKKLETILFPDRPGFIVDRLAVLSDDDFSDFVKLSTEVNARIRINEQTGTVDNGALFYEENLPPETVLYSFLFIEEPIEEPRLVEKDNKLDKKEIADDFCSGKYFPPVFQLGGDATIGRGLFRRHFLVKSSNN